MGRGSRGPGVWQGATGPRGPGASAHSRREARWKPGVESIRMAPPGRAGHGGARQPSAAGVCARHVQGGGQCRAQATGSSGRSARTGRRFREPRGRGGRSGGGPGAVWPSLPHRQPLCVSGTWGGAPTPGAQAGTARRPGRRRGWPGPQEAARLPPGTPAASAGVASGVRGTSKASAAEGCWETWPAAAGREGRKQMSLIWR